MVEHGLALGSIEDNAIGMIAVAGGIAIVLISIVAGSLKGMVKNRAQEQTRREIAAYVAEGSISADDAAKLLGGQDGSDFEKKIADAVSWGMLSPEKAEKLIAAHRQCGPKA